MLRLAVGDCLIAVEHISSTTIPQIVVLLIIDIVVGAGKLSDVEKVLPAA